MFALPDNRGWEFVPALRRSWRDLFWNDSYYSTPSSEQIAAALAEKATAYNRRYGSGPDPRRVMTDDQARALVAGGGIFPAPEKVELL